MSKNISLDVDANALAYAITEAHEFTLSEKTQFLFLLLSDEQMLKAASNVLNIKELKVHSIKNI